MHSFDPKINNENLTKCLQTLKQFYLDLYSYQVTTCNDVLHHSFLFLFLSTTVLHDSQPVECFIIYFKDVFLLTEHCVLQRS